MDKFEIKDLPGKGKSLIAVKEFAVDDVIFEEEPFVSCQFSWNIMYGYSACDHCMRPLETTRENVRRLANDATVEIPLQECCPTAKWLQHFTHCPKCKVRYCSEDCRIDALHKYHRVSCLGPLHSDSSHPLNILNETWKQIHYPPETGTVMLLARVMAMFAQSRDKRAFIDTLESFQSLAVNVEHAIYHKMLGENFEYQMEQLFTAFRNAFASAEYAAFTTPEAFKKLMALIGTNSQGVATSPFAEWTRTVLALRMSAEENTRINQLVDDLYAKVGDFAGDFLNNEGSALYAVQSKINHSCCPNAQCTFPYSNNILVLRATKPIATGQEICISYLDECQLERSRHSRQKILKENYVFVCECELCREQSRDTDETSEDDDDDDCSMEEDASAMDI